MCTVTLSYDEKNEGKEYYTPEELRAILISDLNQIYGVKDAV